LKGKRLLKPVGLRSGKQFGIEPTEHIEQVRIAVILANEMLRWDAISNPDTLKIWSEYASWYESKYPKIYKMGLDISNLVRNIGLDSTEKQIVIMNNIIDEYKLNTVIQI
jgi:hypothetical protein